jgi:hypothetical protein
MQAIFGILVIILVFVIAPIGWGMNIYKLIHTDFQSPYKTEVIRGVGVVIPVIGAVTGYIDINDGQQQQEIKE